MKTWAPLWSSILDSSVWGESKDVRILWITMLAKKDAEGIVWATLPGLARAAVLKPDECEAALKVLLAPDPQSGSKAFDGRRVEPVAGGWKVLNHEFYRDMINKEYRKEYNRRKQQEYRDKTKTKPLKGEQTAIKAADRGDMRTHDSIVEQSLRTANEVETNGK